MAKSFTHCSIHNFGSNSQTSQTPLAMNGPNGKGSNVLCFPEISFTKLYKPAVTNAYAIANAIPLIPIQAPPMAANSASPKPSASFPSKALDI